MPGVKEKKKKRETEYRILHFCQPDNILIMLLRAAFHRCFKHLASHENLGFLGGRGKGSLFSIPFVVGLHFSPDDVRAAHWVFSPMWTPPTWEMLGDCVWGGGPWGVLRGEGAQQGAVP